jgi:type II secretory pathway component GspD/PulD (secretin)
MKTTRMYFATGLVLLILSCSAIAEEKIDQVRFKSGEMGLISFLEMVSEKLDLQIDASGLADSDLSSVTVPETTEGLSSERAKALVLTILYRQSFTWVKDAATDIYRIAKLKDARDQEIPLISDGAPLPDSDLLVTYIMTIAHTPAEYIARTMRSFMPANSRIMSDDATNSVLITDSAHNIAKLKNLVGQLDTPEVAKKAKDFLITRAKKSDSNCPTAAGDTSIQQPWILIGLFSLIALVIGFLARGYVIRRIEGGL